MNAPRSLQGRLGLWLGLTLTAIWVAAASFTALIARDEIERVFDAALQETAQRILPLAVIDILNREEEGTSQRLAAIRDHDEVFTYIVRDDQGRVLLQSHAADPAIFPVWDGAGFRQTGTHRLYGVDAVQGTIRISVAEPLDRRARVAREIQMGLGMPLLVVLPAALLAIVLAVRSSLAPLRRFRDRVAARSARDLTPIATQDLPREIVPLADTVNGLLTRLAEAFEAERSFAANAAHELRTPLAGAIAQAQRLHSETADTTAQTRAAGIEAALKRLTRVSERLMQLARAEGGRLRLDRPTDLRPVLRLVVDDLTRASPTGRIRLAMPEAPVMSDLDPDVLAILVRNLVDNALRHGCPDATVDVHLSAAGALMIENDAAVVPEPTLSALTRRFTRASGQEGAGLGLAIVAAIAERSGGGLTIASPRPGRADGFSVRFQLPGLAA